MFNDDYMDTDHGLKLPVFQHGQIAVESFTFPLTNVDLPGVTITGANGVGTITDDDGIDVTVSDAAATEGAAVTADFTITMSAAASSNITIYYITSNASAAAPGELGAPDRRGRPVRP